MKIARTNILEKILRKYIANFTATIEDISSKNIFNVYKINLISNLRKQKSYQVFFLIFYKHPVRSFFWLFLLNVELNIQRLFNKSSSTNLMTKSGKL